MKTKILTTILLSILSFTVSNAQDNVDWSYKIRFKIENISDNYWRSKNYNYEGFELLLNESEHFQNYVTYELVLDATKNEYTLELRYACISCGNKFKSPMELYLKVNLSDKYSFKTKFSTLIPIYLDELQSSDSYNIVNSKIADIGTINIIDFIESNYDDKSKKILNPYNAIQVKSNGSVHKIRSSKIRKMDKLIVLNNDF
ncbi:MAG: hypothetical protein WCJ62_10325 [Flavobacterium sp.]